MLVPLAATMLLPACRGTAGDSATTPAGTGAVALSQARIELGAVALGTEASSSFQVSNTGDGDLHVFDISFDDDSARVHWSLSEPWHGTIPSGGDLAIGVVCHPATVGDVSAGLHVQSDDPERPSVALRLEATATGTPAIGLQPASLDLGQVAVGEHAVGDVHILNLGNDTLAILGVSLEGSEDFSLEVDPGGDRIEPAAADGLLSVRYAPTRSGGSTGLVRVQSNDPATPEAIVTLAGSSP